MEKFRPAVLSVQGCTAVPLHFSNATFCSIGYNRVNHSNKKHTHTHERSREILEPEVEEDPRKLRQCTQRRRVGLGNTGTSPPPHLFFCGDAAPAGAPAAAPLGAPDPGPGVPRWPRDLSCAPRRVYYKEHPSLLRCSFFSRISLECSFDFFSSRARHFESWVSRA